MVMEVYRLSFKDIPALQPSACCIGYFDGMHRGHQALINKAKEQAKKKNIRSGLITFDPDPWEIFYPESFQQHLFTVQDKIDYCRYMGLDVFYILEFDKEFASQSVEEFHQLLHEMNIESLVCGFDFMYGSKNSGNTTTLQSQSFFTVDVIESVNYSNEKIASSRIEPLIIQGRLKEANSLLGFPYSVSGTIVHGFRRGTDLLEIPTANLDVDYEYVLPEVGVYAGLVFVNGEFYPSMINIGKNPTFDNDKLTVEAHLLDFDEDIYDHQARYFFLEKTRGEFRFDSFQELKDQLHQDVHTTRQVLKGHNEMIQMAKEVWGQKEKTSG